MSESKEQQTTETIKAPAIADFPELSIQLAKFHEAVLKYVMTQVINDESGLAVRVETRIFIENALEKELNKL